MDPSPARFERKTHRSNTDFFVPRHRQAQRVQQPITFTRFQSPHNALELQITFPRIVMIVQNKQRIRQASYNTKSQACARTTRSLNRLRQKETQGEPE